MEKHILVPYSINQRDVAVDVAYDIEVTDDIQAITCRVSRNDQNAWLEMYKFGYRSRLEDGMYTQLFYDNGNIKNINASLFIDKTYEAIMSKEKCRLEPA